MVNPSFVLSFMLLALYLMKGNAESPFVGGIAESDIGEWYEIHYGGLMEIIYESIFHTNASTIHNQVVDLKDNFEKMELYKLQNSLAAGKLSFLAEKMVKIEEVKEDAMDLEILNNIINGSSIFAKNLGTGYACHGVEAMKYMSYAEEIQHEDRNEYIIFYNPDEPENISKRKISVRPDGDKLMITVQRRRTTINWEYSILVDNEDYSEDIKLLGNITSKKIIKIEETTDEEICAMNPKAASKICIPLGKVYNWAVEDAVKNVDTSYQFIEKHVNICK